MEGQEELIMCKHCGSSRHAEEQCPIHEKANLMEIGVPPEFLFRDVITAEDLEDAAEQVKEFVDRQKKSGKWRDKRS